MEKNQDVKMSFWSASVDLPEFPELKEDIDTEVLVVGAGITGIMNAYQLMLKGYDVTIIEGNEILSGTTANTTARVTAQQGVLYGQLAKQMDEASARKYYDSQMAAITEMENVAVKHDIDCDFKRVDTVIYAVHEESIKELEKEAEMYDSLGIEGHLSKGELKLPFETVAELVMKNQAEFHPLKFLKGVLDVAVDSGVKVYEHTRAKSVDENTLHTENGQKINFENLVIATHFPFLDFDGFYFNSFKISYGYGLVTTTTTPPPEDINMSGHDGPGLSLRNIVNPSKETPTVLFGGAGHMSYEDKDMDKQLEILKLYADQLTMNEETLYAYRAQDLMTGDSLPFIGKFQKSHDNRFVATGFNKFGMTNGVLSSMIIKDLMTGDDNEYADLLDPHRKQTAFQHLKQHITNPLHIIESEAKKMTDSHPDIESIELDSGQGTVASEGMKKKGVYREDDSYYVVSNRCTHMGCSLGWNGEDKTWDCPCHGSRFNYDGKVIEGPAVDDLDMEIRRLDS
ncbi:FAD-dependent oxidoreductase [Salinicoccus halitifaciens]|uniref:Glycine/D-amino acid oxidase-like deaminating enzyme/nitrite reductase/ring-hydroxylating ferredoxin subunit n=1 Tax=Salinicoccus halitifaciens TaxID=1073415 RepID=A0ABV2E686_9STAP|nr:FAD-dependent oxidoreductase [Salinicoccus halitifaciens]MCD2137284.1 FAD-dependent oxidoreductase [Salinicoccus halitifaciens]